MQVQDYVENDPSGSDLSLLVGLVDEYTAPVLLKALERCVPESQADLVVSTAHKAKGREWANVRISGDFTIDPEEGKAPSVEELMLAYVSVTRAQNILDPGELAQWVGFQRGTGASSAPVVASASLEPIETVSAAPELPPIEATEPVVPESTAPVVPEGVLDRIQAAADIDPVSDLVRVPQELWQDLMRLAAPRAADPDDFALRLGGVIPVPVPMWRDLTRLAAAQGVEPEELAVRLLGGVVSAFSGEPEF
jgi:hypothetical protein